MNNILNLVTSTLVFASLFFQNSAFAQSFEPSITIENCYQWSRANYPQVQQLDLINKTNSYNLSNASKGNLPQINLNGQVTYQSEVTELPIDLPNVEISTISKFQYKMYGEIYQPLTNFSIVNSKKKQIENDGAIEKQKVEIDLFKLNERIDQLYFGALLIDEKIDLLEFIQIDLDSALIKIKAAIKNGTATITDEQLLYVEKISISQEIEENQSNKEAFIQMLAILTGKNLTTSTQLIKPSFINTSLTNNRPELHLFNLQSSSINIQREQLNNNIIPNVGLFLQAGLGRPALNFLSNDLSPYYIGGVKFNWNLSNFYNQKNNKESLAVAHEKIKSQKNTFLLNTNLTEIQQSSEIKKFQNLIIADKKIVAIRETVLETANVQMTNGLITTIDYIRFLNEVNKARQTLSLHETQLLLSQYNLKTTTGN